MQRRPTRTQCTRVAVHCVPDTEIQVQYSWLYTVYASGCTLPAELCTLAALGGSVRPAVQRRGPAAAGAAGAGAGGAESEPDHAGV